MSQSESQIALKESEQEKNTFKPFLDFRCCICRREILGNELVTQCSNCLTFFHSNHLEIWMNVKNICPVCHCLLFRVNRNAKRKATTRKKNKIRRGKIYLCTYCNYKWEAHSTGHQLWCPECGITSCSHCKTAFGFEFLLGQLQLSGLCPKCNEILTVDSLIAKVNVLNA
ncbi:MAG: hypothetical protein ACW964_13185 [Candidatus Hodarchaeales archaeon]